MVRGLVAGKSAGVIAATWLVARFTHARLDEGLAWLDELGLAVLTGWLASALLATVVLRLPNRAYRIMKEGRRP